jgi:hypothetical protein
MIILNVDLLIVWRIVVMGIEIDWRVPAILAEHVPNQVFKVTPWPAGLSTGTHQAAKTRRAIFCPCNQY